MTLIEMEALVRSLNTESHGREPHLREWPRERKQRGNPADPFHLRVLIWPWKRESSIYDDG